MNNIDVNSYLEVALDEIRNRNWALTKQYLEVNEVEVKNNHFIYDRYELDVEEQLITFYFNVKGERYFFVISVRLNKKEIAGIWMENAHKCYLTATSEKLSLQELSKLTKLKYSDGWSKGDLRKNGKSNYNFSRINFRFHSHESYDLETILNEVLNELEKDKDGILELSKKSNAYISICRHQYISANAGISLDIPTINKLSNLNLGIDIDTYIVGKEIKDIEEAKES